VLPTAGLARSYSGLSVDDFQRRPTHQEASRAALDALAPVAETLAALEGLGNHAAALRMRRESP
jgi:histidinol dehydrogenase